MNPSRSSAAVWWSVLLAVSGCNFSHDKLPQSIVSSACNSIDPDTANYQDHIGPLVKRYCAQCHDSQDLTPLHQYEVSLNGLSPRETWKKAVLAVEAGRMPPPGKAAPDAAERQLLSRWAASGAPIDARAVQLALEECRKPAESMRFDARMSRPKLLPYPSRLKKVEYVLQAEGSGDPSLQLIHLLAKDLGHHDYSAGIQPDDAWTKNIMTAWAHAIAPVCRSPRFRELYSSPASWDALVFRAFGRRMSQDEKGLRDEITSSGFTPERKLELFCFSILGSVEFVASDLQAERVRGYLASLSALLTGRPLDESEFSVVEAQGEAAVMGILTKWTSSAYFSEAIRSMVQQKVKASGRTDSIDYELPGNLAAYVTKRRLPYSSLITADFCVNSTGNKIACDTGAPYAAGLLATRAYLAANRGRFNLTRAGTLLREFLCREYPMETDLEPPIARDRLLPMFQTDSGTQEFGNGTACYTCHSQFGAHAQLFVKFDKQGYWAPFATGEQDPNQEKGASFGGLYTSHLLRPSEATSEYSQMLGRNVENLRSAASVVAASDVFHRCSVKSVLKHFLRLEQAQANRIPQSLLLSLTQRIRQRESDPSMQTLVVEALSHPEVIRSVIEARTP